MQSTHYPNITFLTSTPSTITDNNLALLGTSVAEREQLSLLHPSNPLNNHYTDLTAKLFSEIKIIKEMLWIGTVPSTQIVRVYFSGR
jgi:hypothetical protein